MSLKKSYVVTGVRLESREIVTMELLDEASFAPNIKTAVLRVGRDEYKALGNPPVGSKVTAEITVVPEA